MALNNINLQGKLVKDLDVRYTAEQKAYAIFTIAVQRNYKGKDGKYGADFIDCIASDKVAEHIAKYFHKGSEIIISGELQTRSIEDRGEKRKATLVNIGKVFFTSGKSETQATAPAEATTEPTESGELPFEK